MSTEPQQPFDTEQCRPPRFTALIPFFVFMAFYLGLSIWVGDFYKTPMPAAFLVASATAMFLDTKQSLANKLEIYAKGMGEPNIMIMCLIFILSGAFASLAKGMGAVDSAVVIARNLIPTSLMLIGMFIVSCFISLSIGTSCGTIAALAPIALGLAKPLDMSPAIILGAVVGGSMFGDNLSMISDTTIAATRTQGVQMRDKFATNIRIVIPAVVLTLVIYLFSISNDEAAIANIPKITWKDIVAIIPYVLILICALLGMNVMFLLFSGTIISFAIGMFTGALGDFKVAFWNGLDLIGKGTLGMSETLIVAILAGGLLKIIRYNGGIDYLMQIIQKPIKRSKDCEFGIMLLVAVINLFTANNTVAIVIAGPIAKTLSDQYSCSPKRIASILDTTSCAIQGLIPYGAQILIAIGLANTAGIKIAPTELIATLYYPIFLAFTVIFAIAINKTKKK